MSELAELLVREALEEIRAALLVRARERQRALEGLGGGSQPTSCPVDLALPSRLVAAAAELRRREAAALAVPKPEQAEPVLVEPVTNEGTGNADVGVHSGAADWMAGKRERHRQSRYGPYQLTGVSPRKPAAQPAA